MRASAAYRLIPVSPTDAPTPEIVDVDPMTTAVVRDVVATDELAGLLRPALPPSPTSSTARASPSPGRRIAAYHGPPAATADLEAGFPTQQAIEPDGDVDGRLACPAAARSTRLVHEGGYDELRPRAWQRLGAWIAEQGLTAGPLLWEVYVTEPNPDMVPADLRTELDWLLTD